jgi:hypothetical protein
MAATLCLIVAPGSTGQQCLGQASGAQHTAHRYLHTATCTQHIACSDQRSALNTLRSTHRTPHTSHAARSRMWPRNKNCLSKKTAADLHPHGLLALPCNPRDHPEHNLSPNPSARVHRNSSNLSTSPKGAVQCHLKATGEPSRMSQDPWIKTQASIVYMTTSSRVVVQLERLREVTSDCP